MLEDWFLVWDVQQRPVEADDGPFLPFFLMLTAIGESIRRYVNLWSVECHLSVWSTAIDVKRHRSRRAKGLMLCILHLCCVNTNEAFCSSEIRNPTQNVSTKPVQDCAGVHWANDIYFSLVDFAPKSHP